MLMRSLDSGDTSIEDQHRHIVPSSNIDMHSSIVEAERHVSVFLDIGASTIMVAIGSVDTIVCAFISDSQHAWIAYADCLRFKNRKGWCIEEHKKHIVITLTIIFGSATGTYNVLNSKNLTDKLDEGYHILTSDFMPNNDALTEGACTYVLEKKDWLLKFTFYKIWYIIYISLKMINIKEENMKLPGLHFIKYDI